MKKILSLLLTSSSLFSMELDVLRYDRQAATVKSMHKKMHVEPQTELNAVRFNTQAASIKSNNKKMLIEQKSVFVPNQLGTLELSHGKKGFCVHKDDKKHIIQKYFIDKTIRNMTKDELKQFLKVGYLSLNQMDNGEFSLKANGRINGGGPIGASIGAFIGKAAVYVVGHGAIQVAAIITGPAYPVTVMTLEAWFAVPIETASMAGAVAGGMIGAVATGPV